MTIGTGSNDTLSTIAAGEVLIGLGGDDSLISTHDQTTLLGGNKNDTLRTDFVPATGADTVATGTQKGEGGNDLMGLKIQSGFVSGDAIFSAIQDGGAGQDSIVGLVDSFADGKADATLIVDGGSGDDSITATTVAESASAQSETTTYVVGGGGDDTIKTGNEAGGITSARVEGGNGNDSLTVSTSTSSGFEHGDTDVKVFAGGGDDFVSVTSSSNSNDANSDFVHVIDGESGNDTLSSEVLPSGQDFAIDVDVTMRGGSGNDSISLTVGDSPAFGAIAQSDMDIDTLLEGGFGMDSLSTYVLAHDQFGGGQADVRNEMNGGSSNDTLLSQIDVQLAVALALPFPTFFNELNGDGGHDVIEGQIFGTSGGLPLTFEGINNLYGGTGNDTIKAVGGDGNTLDGGSGNDSLIGSENTDSIVGGSGADTIIGGGGNDFVTGGGGGDTFRFNVADVVVTDIGDWNTAQDILDTDLVDLNGNGLVDEIDAASSIFWDGFSGSLMIFTGGLQIYFANSGSASISSIADLVDDPLTQLI